MDQLASPDVLNLIHEARNLTEADINESLLKFLEATQKAGCCMKQATTLKTAESSMQSLVCRT